jgi:DNA-directed RNA polymerase subunit L
MKLKLDDIKKKLYEKYIVNQFKEESLKTVEILLDNETYTITNFLTSLLQERNDVEYAGANKYNELVKQITILITYKKETKNPIDPIFETIDEVSKRMEILENKFYLLGQKYIQKFEESPKIDKIKKKSK